MARSLTLTVPFINVLPLQFHCRQGVTLPGYVLVCEVFPAKTTDDGRSVIWAVLATSHGSSLCGRPLHSPLAPSGDRYIDSWLIRRTTVLVGIRYISRENSRFLPMLSCLKMCSVIIETIVYNLFRFYMLKKACCVDASFSTKEASTQ